jgi:cytochrome c
MRAEFADLAQQTSSFSGLWSLHMRTDTRIRAAVCSIMLASAGTLLVPLTAYAKGDAAAAEKIFAHCAPCHSTKPGENKVGPSLAGVFGRKSGTEPRLQLFVAIKDLNVTGMNQA